MHQDKINLRITGHIVMQRSTNDGPFEVVYNDHNDLQVGWDNIMRRALAGQTGAILGKIGAYKNNVLLAYASVNEFITPSSPSNELELVALFNTESFDDTLDEIRLESDLGTFSARDGLSVVKDGNSQITVAWTLKFNVN